MPYYIENVLIFMFSPPFSRGHNCQFGHNFPWGLSVIPLIISREHVFLLKSSDFLRLHCRQPAMLCQSSLVHLNIDFGIKQVVRALKDQEQERQ